MFKLIHIADEHWDQDKLEKCRPSAGFIEQKSQELHPDLIVIAGDLQNKRQYLTGSSAVLPMLDHVRFLAAIAPVIIVYGNAEHDPPGSLDILRELRTDFPVYVANKAETIVYFDGAGIAQSCFLKHDLCQPAEMQRASAIVHLFPYPTKQWFLAGRENLSIDESNQLIQDALRKIFTGFGAISMDTGCPVLLIGHCNVSGAELSTGQTLLGQDVMVSKHDLELAEADYYALGHIHKAQEVGPRMHYSGSIYHCNFGEVEKKGFNLVSLDPTIARVNDQDQLVNVEFIEIPSWPLSLHELNWDEESGPKPMFWDPNDACDWEGAELRVRVNATKEKHALITDAEIESRYRLAHSITIERIISPEERIRSAEIVKAKTLPEKVVEWGRSIEKEISPEVLTLASEVERSVIS